VRHETFLKRRRKMKMDYKLIQKKKPHRSKNEKKEGAKTEKKIGKLESHGSSLAERESRSPGD